MKLAIVYGIMRVNFKTSERASRVAVMEPTIAVHPFKQESPAAAMVVNANYDLVLSAIDRLLSDRYAHACSCARCRRDMAALALNFLPPHYYTEEEQGKKFGSPWVMIENAVAEAIERVRETPRHERIHIPQGGCT